MKELEKTKSVCPECLKEGDVKKIDAKIIEENGKIYITKKCPEHGSFKDILFSDSDVYHRWKKYHVDGEGIENTEVKSWLSPENKLYDKHLSQTVLTNLLLTNRCNLRCSYCFMNAGASGYVYEPSLEQMRKMMDQVREEKPVPSNAIQLSGGEPTIRDDLFEIIEMAKDMGFSHIQLNTNGIKLAEDLDYCRKIKESGVNTVYMSFDGVSKGTNPWIEQNKKAIENLRKVGHESVVLVPVVMKTNLDELGKIVEFAMENIDVVRGVNFQPISFCGRLENVNEEKIRKERADYVDMMEALEKNLNEQIKREDFYPVPFVHPISKLIEVFKGEKQVEFTANPMCLSGSENMVIYNSNRPTIDSISDFTDDLFTKYREKVMRIGNAEVLDVSSFNYKVPTLDGLTHLKKLIKKPGKELQRIRTESGREIDITPDHTVFVKENGNMELKEVRKLKIGDSLILSNQIPKGKETEEINLIEILRKRKEIPKKLYVQGFRDKLEGHKAESSWMDLFKNIGIKDRKIYDWLRRDSVPLDVFLKLLDNYNISLDGLKIRGISGKDLSLKIRLNKELMRLIGYFISEGHLSAKYGKTYNVGFSNSNSEILEDIKYCLKKLKWDYHTHMSHGRPQIILSGRIYYLLFNYFFGLNKGAQNKNLPQFALSLPETLIAEMLSGLATGDGNIQAVKNKNSLRICITTSSRELVSGLSNLLLRLGIKPHFWFEDTKDTEFKIEGRIAKRVGDKWRVVISRWDNINKLLNYGFRFIDKERNDILQSVKPKRQFEYNKEKHHTEKIKSITLLKEKPEHVFDIEVEEPHGFLLNGVLVHNCGGATYIFIDNGKIIPITRFIDVEGFMKFIKELSEKKGMFKKARIVSSFVKNVGKYIDKEKSPEELNIKDLLVGAITKGNYSALGKFHKKSLYIGSMWFQDPWNLDLERLKRCVIHYSTPEGVIPFCAYNGLGLGEKIRKKHSIPIKEWEEKTGKKLKDDLWKGGRIA